VKIDDDIIIDLDLDHDRQIIVIEMIGMIVHKQTLTLNRLWF
jgi:hypothetical protein